MTGWLPVAGRYQLETHFGDRSFPCLTDRPLSFFAMFRRAVARNPEGEALVAGAFRCSWQELSQLVDAFASGLAGRGVKEGNRVILFLGNRAEFVIALLATARIGAIAVPVGVREQAPGLAYIAEQSGAWAILHEAALADRIPDLPFALSIGDEDVRSLVRAFSLPGAKLCEAPMDEESPALLMYTSGTTGRPKGAIISHMALVHVGAAYAECMALEAGDRSVCVVPLSHISGVTASLCSMMFVGGCTIIAPEFKAEQFLALAEQEGMTHTLMVPAMYNLLLSRADFSAFDLTSWRIGAFGGAPMPIPTITALSARLNGLRLMNCYGATETCGGVTIMPARELLAHSDSVGWAIPGAAIRAVDEDGRHVPPGQPGELWISGATVTPGYWRDPQATAANLVRGFWRSGDLGSVDENGFVRVLDRLKDMINRGGYKIFTAEVESILMAHPAVLEAAVIAKPCAILGERVHAFVTPRQGFEALIPEELDAYCSTRMTDYKRPESYTIGPEALPRNLNGKVVKAELRARLNQAPAQAS